MLTSDQIEQYELYGFLIIDDAVALNLVEPLRQASNRLVTKTREGTWPHKRDAGDGDIWGVGHLLHPDVCETVFAEYIASSMVIDVVADLLSVSGAPEDTPLQLELVNMLVNPATTDHQIGWHRDLVSVEQSSQDELTALLGARHGIQWNAALYEDACLQIVPGSHRRASTQTERATVQHRPMEALQDQLVVRLDPGQGVYYNANLLHRGVYPRATVRRTLHACMGTMEGSESREDLYRWLSWMTDASFGETLPERLRPLHVNFMQMARKKIAAEDSD
ncbi:MAG: hypothetical protein HOH43_15090 [Candidatus Latescibacteria bacterium]|jgi:hypothetical protein|nr:hypothetical protein [Candidatus Latescibacterota bacterium]